MSLPPIPERVTAGAALLDELFPDWAVQEDLSSLNMRGCEDCVLGQIRAGYSNNLFAVAALHQHKGGHGDAADYELGFDLPLGQQTNEENWDELEACWREEIQKRTQTKEDS